MAIWDFQHQVVVITGGTGGLGLELTKSFLAAGAKVHLCGGNDKKLAAAEAELQQAYGNKEFQLQMVDVRDIKALQSWLNGVLAQEQRIDVLVNAAGICDTVHASQVDEELWDRMIDVNLKGTFFTMQLVAEAMKAQGYGHIVNISSVSAYNGGTLVSPPYGASKAGVLALTKSFASLYSAFGVCVNSVSPGPFETDMIADFTEAGRNILMSKTPTGRIGSPEDIVQSILFLSDKSTKHITGAALDVNGGLYMR